MKNKLMRKFLLLTMTGILVVGGSFAEQKVQVNAIEIIQPEMEQPEIELPEAGQPEEESLAGYSTDEILLGSFWTSDNDNSDTLYWSVDGVNFYELAVAYKDAFPNDERMLLDKNYVLYHYDSETKQPLFIVNEQNYNSYTPYTIDWKTQTSVRGETQYFDDANPGYGHCTLHDPSIMYKDGYFWMIAGFTLGDGAEEKYVPMFGYSKDLEHWSFPSSGSDINVTLEKEPAGKELYGNHWDAVAPDLFLDDDGTVYIVFCAGYSSRFHTGPAYGDVMQPYIIKVNSLSVTADPAVYPEITPSITYDLARQIQLPCMQAGHERYSVAHNHIDSSLVKFGEYYYYSVKENNVTCEIWRIRDLSKVGNPNAWEQVVDDAISGYEGPCLTKFQNQYFLYGDRLTGFIPDDEQIPFPTEGTWVCKATTGTTGQLDKYTGFLESNIIEIKTYDSNGNIKANRHGSVITLTGKAAQIVRQRAKKVNPRLSDAALQPAYKASSWKNTGWYHKESYRFETFGQKAVRFYYYKDVRQGVKLRSDGTPDPNYRGKEIFDSATQGWYWMDAVTDGSMAVSKDVYQTSMAGPYGEYSAKEAQKLGYEVTDMNARYGKWVRYDEYGRMCKGQVFAKIPGTEDYGYWYFDDTFGTMIKGLATVPKVESEWVPLLNFKGEPIKLIDGTIVNTLHWYMVDSKGNRVEDPNKAAKRTVYYSPIDGTMQFGFVPIGADLYYFNPGGEAVNGWGIDDPTVPGYATYGTSGICWYDQGKRAGFKMKVDSNGNPILKNGKAQPDLSYRGKEIFDSVGNGGWFWCDNVLNGAIAKGKEVYQESDAGPWAEDPKTGKGKWVRYGAYGEMIKGWYVDGNKTYYYDKVFGTMAKGNVLIDGLPYSFDPNTGVLIK